MTIVTRTRDVIAFGDGGNGTQIVDFTRLLLGVPTTAASDVTIDISFLGDFESPFGGQGDEFRLNIESNFSAWFTGNEYEASTASFTIGQTTWQSIISDGTIEITYDMGEGVQDFSDINGGLEEYINLTFTWDDGTNTSIPPSKPDTLTKSGTDGDDWLPGTDGNDIINGLGGNDSIFAGNGDDIVNGGAGDDAIGGGTGADKLYGDADNDTLFGGDGSDELRGGEGNDVLFGGEGNDSIYGGEGDDVAWGGNGNDLVKGANGNDILGGGLGNDEIHGGAGHDAVYGGAGNDKLFGNMGNDRLFGGDGRDQLTGGLGNDIMAGGTGADTFIFGKNDGDDRITDFDVGKGDRIDLSGQIYSMTENKDGFAVLELSGGGTILLDHVAVGEVSADWFLLA